MPARTMPNARFLPLMAALACLALGLFGPSMLRDGDTFWHVAAGQWILAHHAVLRTDPFSFTMAGQPWQAHEWLAEVAMALAYRAGGWAGVVALYAAVLAALAATLGVALARAMPAAAALVALVLALCCVAPNLLARPHLAGLLLLAWWVAALLRGVARGRPPWAALPLMALWANLHGGYMLGLVLAVPLGLEAVAARGPGSRGGLRGWLRGAAPWGGFVALAAGCASLTPQGPAGLLFPFRLVRLASLAMVTEWRAPDFSQPQPVELAVLAALFVLLSRGVRLPAWRLLTLLGLVHLALAQNRQGMVLGVAGALLLAGPLGAALGGPGAVRAARPGETDRPVRPAWAWRAWGPVLAGVAAVALVGLRVTLPPRIEDAASAPVAALRAVPAALAARPVLNAYDFGGYLILHGVRPFVDGRTDLYGDAFLGGYRALARDPAALGAAVARWDLGWAILPPGSAMARLLALQPGWRVLHADAVAVVLARGDGVPDARVAGAGTPSGG